MLTVLEKTNTMENKIPPVITPGAPHVEFTQAELEMPEGMSKHFVTAALCAVKLPLEMKQVAEKGERYLKHIKTCFESWIQPPPLALLQHLSASNLLYTGPFQDLGGKCSQLRFQINIR